MNIETYDLDSTFLGYAEKMGLIFPNAFLDPAYWNDFPNAGPNFRAQAERAYADAISNAWEEAFARHGIDICPCPGSVSVEYYPDLSRTPYPVPAHFGGSPEEDSLIDNVALTARGLINTALEEWNDHVVTCAP